jgi:hypothetical protein
VEPSPEVVSKLREVVSQGISPEDSRRQRRALVSSAVGGTAGLAATWAFLEFADGVRSTSSWRLPATLVAMSLAGAALQYRRLGPRLPQEHPEQDLAALARLYALCPSCGELVGRYALGCAACGALRRPRAAVVGVILLAVATFATLVWGWIKTGRS